jgi:hypothetical protein
MKTGREMKRVLQIWWLGACLGPLAAAAQMPGALLAGDLPYDRQMALASAGEADLPQGLWDARAESRYGGELITCDLIPAPEGVRILWTTGAEWRSRVFLIERMRPDGRFAIIGQQRAAGFSRSLLPYEFTDAAPPAGRQVYRLRQLDENGGSHTGPELVYDPSEFQGMALAPDAGLVRITVVDQEGRPLAVAVRGADELNIQQLPAGAWALRIEQQGVVRDIPLHRP